MSATVWGNEKTQYFNTLSPDKVLDAVEAVGIKTTGRVMHLASMENRVYEIEVDGVESDNPSDHFKIVKFYRPGRWSKDQIQDEHNFIFDLNENDISAIAPLKIDNESVHQNDDGLYFTLFPKKGGRACDEWTDTLLEQMGRLLARLHNTGRIRKATHRLELNIENFGRKNLELILGSNHLPMEYKESYQNLCQTLFQISEPLFNGINIQRIHGDCHHGNIVLNDGRPFLIDFDDMSMGPKVQDIWMIVPGRDQYSMEQRKVLINAYREMSDLDPRELKLIEVLRALRIIHFSAWIGHRFDDQAFKRAFPTYGSSQYWEKELHDLRQQISYIQDDMSLY